MDTGSLVKWGAIGIGAYWLYTRFFAAPAAAAVAETPTASPVPTSVASTAVVARGHGRHVQTRQSAASSAAPAGGYSAQDCETARTMFGQTLPGCAPASAGGMDALYRSIEAAAASDPAVVNGAAVGDVWNYYANQITGKQNSPSWPSGPITLAQYWSAMAGNIRQATGMSGLGLYGSLAALTAQYESRGYN